MTETPGLFLGRKQRDGLWSTWAYRSRICRLLCVLLGYTLGQGIPRPICTYQGGAVDLYASRCGVCGNAAKTIMVCDNAVDVETCPTTIYPFVHKRRVPLSSSKIEVIAEVFFALYTVVATRLDDLQCVYMEV